MVAFSSLRNVCKITQSKLLNVLRTNANRSNVESIRSMSGHRTFPIVPSRFQYDKFKDMFHFYFMVAAIPMGLFVTYVNVFIGPATLTEIPEGYTPEHWEYYKHPITRWIARYWLPKPQQEYEKLMHHLYEDDELSKIRRLTSKVKGLMEDRADYQAYYYIPYTPANYARANREIKKEMDDAFGTND